MKKTIQKIQSNLLYNKANRLEDKIDKLILYIPVKSDQLEAKNKNKIERLDMKLKSSLVELEINTKAKAYFEHHKKLEFEKIESELYWNLRHVEETLRKSNDEAVHRGYLQKLSVYYETQKELLNKSFDQYKFVKKLIRKTNLTYSQFEIDVLKFIATSNQLLQNALSKVKFNADELASKLYDHKEDTIAKIQENTDKTVAKLQKTHDALNHKYFTKYIEKRRRKEAKELKNLAKKGVAQFESQGKEILGKELNKIKLSVDEFILNLENIRKTQSDIIQANTDQIIAGLPAIHEASTRKCFEKYDLDVANAHEKYSDVAFEQYMNKRKKIQLSYLQNGSIETEIDKFELQAKQLLETRLNDIKHNVDEFALKLQSDKDDVIHKIQVKTDKTVAKLQAKRQLYMEKLTLKRENEKQHLIASFQTNINNQNVTTNNHASTHDEAENAPEVQLQNILSLYEPDNDTHLVVEDLLMQFGGLKAVNHLTFKVKRNEIFGLIGPNGAGKTTVFNCITQFYKPTSGHLYYKNKNNEVFSLLDLKVHNVIKYGIVRTFQNVELIWELSVLDNLLVGAHTSYRSSFIGQLFSLPSLRKEEDITRAKALKILQDLNLESYKDSQPVGLPYGILKRIELARTLMLNPELIILDEPAAGLNDTETIELAHTIKRIRDEYQVTIFLVEHDMGLVMDVCDTICAISFGKKLAIGTPAEIQSNKAVQEAYLGGAVGV